MLTWLTNVLLIGVVFLFCFNLLVMIRSFARFFTYLLTKSDLCKKPVRIRHNFEFYQTEIIER